VKTSSAVSMISAGRASLRLCHFWFGIRHRHHVNDPKSHLMWDWQSSSRLPAEGFKVPGARVMAVDSFTHASTTLKRLATWYDEISPTCHEFCQAGGGDLVDAKLIFAHVQPSSWCLAGGVLIALLSAASDGSGQSKQKKVLPRRREGNAYQLADAKLALG